MNSSDWDGLTHEERMREFLALNTDEIVQKYLAPDQDRDDFRKQVLNDRRFWGPQNVEEFISIDEPPTKETAIGAWRDLSRSEALLELIDNSIDVWVRRQKKYPRETAERLQIYIDIDNDLGELTYEDNSGGVDYDKLINLVVPGHSDTESIDWSIGSYKTGGKKAIFKLASEASIWTRYWNPVGTTDEAYEIHLDRRWLTHATDYSFLIGRLKDKSRFEKGQTVYALRLHEAARDWDVRIIEEITKEIRRNYTLLLVRNPKIEIYLNDRSNPLRPFEDMYKFTAVHDPSKNLDLRPQRIRFKTRISALGQDHDVELEILLGCRTTAGGAKGEDAHGIDLYGNDRLFAHQDYERFREWYELPKGAARNFVRGYINIHGPNILIPWDTHKRHLNSEREVIQVLKEAPYIRQFFKTWRDAYQALARSPEIKKTISKELTPKFKNQDLYVPFTNAVTLPKKKVGAKLDSKIHRPQVPESKAVIKPIEIKLLFSDAEYRRLLKAFDIQPDDNDARSKLVDVIQEDLRSKIA